MGTIEDRGLTVKATRTNIDNMRKVLESHPDIGFVMIRDPRDHELTEAAAMYPDHLVADLSNPEFIRNENLLNVLPARAYWVTQEEARELREKGALWRVSDTQNQ